MDLAHSLLCQQDFPGKNTGVGCQFLLQGTFPTQGLNLCFLHQQVGFFFNHWATKEALLFYYCPLQSEADPLEKTLMLGNMEGRRRRDDRGRDGWMASPSQWTYSLGKESTLPQGCSINRHSITEWVNKEASSSYRPSFSTPSSQRHLPTCSFQPHGEPPLHYSSVSLPGLLQTSQKPPLLLLNKHRCPGWSIEHLNQMDAFF